MELCPRAPVQFTDLSIRQLSHGEGCKTSPHFSHKCPRPSHCNTGLIKFPRQCEGEAHWLRLKSGLLRRAWPIPQPGPSLSIPSQSATVHFSRVPANQYTAKKSFLVGPLPPWLAVGAVGSRRSSRPAEGIPKTRSTNCEDCLLETISHKGSQYRHQEVLPQFETPSPAQVPASQHRCELGFVGPYHNG